MKRIIVCGGRDFNNLAQLEHVLAIVHARRGIACIIEGGANGADRMARNWAEKCKIPVETFEAKWNEQGRRAGPVRNTLMLEQGKPDAVIAFLGGAGTKNMVEQARAARVPVMTPGDWYPKPEGSQAA